MLVTWNRLHVFTSIMRNFIVQMQTNIMSESIQLDFHGLF